MNNIAKIGLGISLLAGLSFSFTSCADFLDEELTTKYSTEYFDTCLLYTSPSPRDCS